jgi:hypothetical protein
MVTILVNAKPPRLIPSKPHSFLYQVEENLTCLRNRSTRFMVSIGGISQERSDMLPRYTLEVIRLRQGYGSTSPAWPRLEWDKSGNSHWGCFETTDSG